MATISFQRPPARDSHQASGVPTSSSTAVEITASFSVSQIVSIMAGSNSGAASVMGQSSIA
ncbi:hypothetical protein ORIO_17665 [Cereibacter azotoformans]|uniref:hypothetical protein n=1 Tax=Cereibacter azotoformans TaxID=43057 RepID=UPI00030FC923|nr:hypothetical protein [Cereibacter azotoformans]ULB11694.1 hypothetical protein ORIO_17665 [Cereibacter azotoformans]